MKRFTLLLFLLISVTLISFAKKDVNAWKNEKTLNQQYSVFKKNLNYWNGSYYLKELQLNQFYNAVHDSISVLEREVLDNKNRVISLQNKLDSKIEESENIQAELNASIKRENSIRVFGMNLNKSVYSLSMYIFILGVLVLAAMVFLLYRRSIVVTLRTKNEFNELKEEFEIHKKNSLERYTKMNMELHKTRMKLNKK
jgi:hypothetical protein